MKSNTVSIVLSSISLACVIAITVCGAVAHSSHAKCAEQTATEVSEPVSNGIVCFQLEEVIAQYDYAIELSEGFEKKANSVGQEIQRRGSKLEADVKEWQNKIDKGLITRSVAESQGQRLQQREAEFNQYAQSKQAELAEEQQVILNNIAQAIKEYVDQYRVEKGYSLVLSTQGSILPAPVASFDGALDKTQEIVSGLNAAYKQPKK